MLMMCSFASLSGIILLSHALLSPESHLGILLAKAFTMLVPSKKEKSTTKRIDRKANLKVAE
jgi:hypothetical protein